MEPVVWQEVVCAVHVRVESHVCVRNLYPRPLVTIWVELRSHVKVSSKDARQLLMHVRFRGWFKSRRRKVKHIA
jgi:hypothetical protein